MHCNYQDCTNKRVPCSKITFFNLPKDDRRQIWIENSGNPELKLINGNSVRMFCEQHFDPKYLRKQFTRTILHKNAVPYKYRSVMNDIQINSEITQKGGGEIHLKSTRDNSHVYITPDEQHDSESEIEILEDEDDYSELNQHEQQHENIEYADQDVNEPESLETEVHTEILENDNGVVEVNNRILFPDTETKKSNQKMCKPVQSSQKRTHEVLEEAFGDLIDIKNDEPKAKTANLIHNGNTSYTQDEHFALSLVGYLQRLPHRTKSKAKLKILEYLTDLEYDSSAKLK